MPPKHMPPSQGRKPLNKQAGSPLVVEMLQPVGEANSDFPLQCSKPCWLSANLPSHCFFFRGSQLLRDEASARANTP